MINIKRFSRSAGSFTFFIAAIILPLIFILFSLSLDVSSYYAVSDRVQKSADEASIYAQKFLPSRDDAVKAAGLYLDSNLLNTGLDLSNKQISISNDGVSILINSSVPVAFARFFGLNTGIPISVFAHSVAVSQDVYVAIDSSSYLAPPPTESASWGDPLVWPAANFFKNEVKIRDQSGRLLSPTALTQQCFNPSFSAIKEAGLFLYNYYNSYDLNAIGLGFYPGNQYFIDEVRTLQKAGMRVDSVNNPGEADFIANSGSLYARNEWCAAIAEREVSVTHYRFPDINSRVERQYDESLKPSEMIIPGRNAFNSEYSPFLKGSEVIWSQAVNNSLETNFVEVLNVAASSLLSTSGLSDRGALNAASNKTLYVVAGNLPCVAGRCFPDTTTSDSLKDSLNEIKKNLAAFKLKLKIFYVALNYNQGIESAAWESNSQKFKEFFHSFSDQDLETVYISAKSRDALVESILPKLVLDRRNVLVTK